MMGVSYPETAETTYLLLAYQKGGIGRERLQKFAERQMKIECGDYLSAVAEEEI